MSTNPVLTYRCGCSGPAFNDDYANIYVRPDKNRCAKHATEDVTRVYECGCFVKTRYSSTMDIVHGTHHEPMRCEVHKAGQFKSTLPFASPIGFTILPCTCIGKEIGWSLSGQEPLYFVPASNVCAAHKTKGATSTFVMQKCGCALIDSNAPMYCDLHSAASQQQYSDPFMKPSDKPVVLRKK